MSLKRRFKKWIIGGAVLLGIALYLVLISYICSLGQDIELENLVIDQTVTHIGRQFHEEFTALWRWPPGFDDMSIFISEEPTGQYGSWIKIEVGGLIEKTIVYRKPLKPKVGVIEEEVLVGIGAVQSFFASHGYSGDDPDLKGNGI